MTKSILKCVVSYKFKINQQELSVHSKEKGKVPNLKVYMTTKV